ncbi:hypothetical protein RB195_005017 [Necator americanus]|uniref:Mos1 transposase HTH domain-containing protein n=1 Tax=Necator americanus TaxID=51031 RepID=A0ABR1BPA6_NECAM
MKILRSMWINERIPDTWRHAIIIFFHKKLSGEELCELCDRSLELLKYFFAAYHTQGLGLFWIGFFKYRGGTKRDEQVGSSPGRSTIGKERQESVWQWYSKSILLAFPGCGTRGTRENRLTAPVLPSAPRSSAQLRLPLHQLDILHDRLRPPTTRLPIAL